MQLPLEKWLTENPIPEEAAICFEESARCYKASAYRAALLFGYVGWGLTLRSRILSASCPSGVIPSKWEAIQSSLRNEDKWDSEVFDCTQTQPPKAIFNVSDDLRLQVKYWKDRRNDCAHFKANAISAAHVESFWSFVQSNLGRFVPNGSIPDILERIDRHFDPNITPPGSDIAPITKMIPSAVATPDLPGFMKTLVEKLSLKTGLLTIPREAEISTVHDGILALGHSNVATALVDFLENNINLLGNLVRRNPSRVLFFAGKPALLRRLWREIFFKTPAQISLSTQPSFATI